MSQNVIEVKKLSKSFGTVKAVRDLSFQVKKGELFAFLGARPIVWLTGRLAGQA